MHLYAVMQIGLFFILKLKPFPEEHAWGEGMWKENNYMGCACLKV